MVQTNAKRARVLEQYRETRTAQERNKAIWGNQPSDCAALPIEGQERPGHLGPSRLHCQPGHRGPNSRPSNLWPQTSRKLRSEGCSSAMPRFDTQSLWKRKNRTGLVPFEFHPPRRGREDPEVGTLTSLAKSECLSQNSSRGGGGGLFRCRLATDHFPKRPLEDAGRNRDKVLVEL
jgi:hypothetical protein